MVLMTALAVSLMAVCGVILVGIGGFFIALRPSLLPEDLLFMDTTVDRIEAQVPGLTRWLRRVFWVMGGYISSTGLLVVFVATTELRDGNSTALAILGLAGIASIGWMTIVNFLLHSHFRWALLALTGLWTAGLLLAAIAQWS